VVGLLAALKNAYSNNLQKAQRAFLQTDAARRSGTAGNPATAAIQDRNNEGAFIAALLGPAAPLATLPVAAAGLGYEGVKGLGQATGLGKYLPGPLKTDETSSPASLDNVAALMRGFTGNGS
jgi:hypothetical protein